MRRRILVVCTAALCVVGLLAVRVSTSSAQAPAARHYRSAASTANAYFDVLNTGMSNGNFSGLSSVFASDAVLTKSNTDGTTTVYTGLAQITAFYQSLYQKLPGWQWTTDVERPLTKNSTVIAYEHAGSPPLSVASRCVHVFVVKRGRITGYDWAAFYPGQK